MRDLSAQAPQKARQISPRTREKKKRKFPQSSPRAYKGAKEKILRPVAKEGKKLEQLRPARKVEQKRKQQSQRKQQTGEGKARGAMLIGKSYSGWILFWPEVGERSGQRRRRDKGDAGAGNKGEGTKKTKERCI